MAVSSDFEDLLRLFSDNQIEYLVVGGYAVIKYTEPRYTSDDPLIARIRRVLGEETVQRARETESA